MPDESELTPEQIEGLERLEKIVAKDTDLVARQQEARMKIEHQDQWRRGQAERDLDRMRADAIPGVAEDLRNNYGIPAELAERAAEALLDGDDARALRIVRGDE